LGQWTANLPVKSSPCDFLQGSWTKALSTLHCAGGYHRTFGFIGCIPDRDSAECELTQLQNQHGPRLLKAIIRKDKRPARPTGSGTSRTYTLRYTIRETETRTLF